VNTTRTRLAAGLALAAVFVLASAPRARAQGGPAAKDVVVTNTPANPVPVRNVDEGSRQPFQRPFSVNLAPTESFGEATFTVPAGKRIVVEYASLRASLPPGQTVFVNIVTTTAGQSAFHPVLISDQGMYGVLHLVGASHQTRIYADPGTTITVQFGRDPSAGAPGGANFFMTLSGYRVDVP
jgi:hypothetical protein